MRSRLLTAVSAVAVVAGLAVVVPRPGAETAVMVPVPAVPAAGTGPGHDDGLTGIKPTHP